MAEIDLGNVMGPQGEDGSQWYWGTAITGTSTSGAVFSSSGITNARVNDKYYNTSTSNIYTCTTEGAESVDLCAKIINKKKKQGNIGPAGPTGSVDFTTPITFSIAGTRSDLASGDSIATLFGKTQKWFADINSGGASTLLATNLSANRALISNANGKVAVSSVTSTELGYLDGVTSAIQTQLNTINTSIGTLSDLTTTAKSSLVAAANELNGKTIKIKKFEVEVTTEANVDSPSGMYQGDGYIKSQPDYPDGTVYAVIMYGARSKADASRGAIVAYRNEDGYFCVSSPKQASTEFIVSVVVFYSD